MTIKAATARNAKLNYFNFEEIQYPTNSEMISPMTVSTTWGLPTIRIHVTKTTKDANKPTTLLIFFLKVQVHLDRYTLRILTISQ